jgi:hypothetical protein
MQRLTHFTNILRTKVFVGNSIAMKKEVLMTTEASRGRSNALLTRAVAAGVLGGILIDVFLVVLGSPFPGLYQFVASGLIGKAAFSSTAYIGLGLIIHFAISIVWAILYAYVVSALYTLRRWLITGLIFGIIVAIVMSIVQWAVHLSGTPSFLDFVLGLPEHVLFFGWPIAWFLSRHERDSRSIDGVAP